MNYQTIFDEDPEDGFALRGDVYMWNMMRAATRNNLLSSPDQKDNLQEELEAMVRHVYQTVTGQALVGKGEDLVPLFEKVGYGMSKGVCCREWWIETGLPRLSVGLKGCCPLPRTKGKSNAKRRFKR